MKNTKQRQPETRQSRQKTRIVELLQTTESHPTADWIYAQLKKEFPKLSLGTVYRNLSVLVEQGIVKKIHFGSTFDRFEANTMKHYHLVCKSCGKIIDFQMPIYDEINRKASAMTDFSIQNHMIEFFGTCSTCKGSKKIKNG